MSLSNSRLSYTDCFSLLDQALEAERGIRVEVASPEKANYLRMRIHQARTIDRAQNKITYPDPEHQMHGRSPYDVLVCRIDDSNGAAWVYIDKVKVEIGRIEAIPVDHQIEFQEVRQIEGPKAEPEPEGMKMIEDRNVEIMPTIRRR